MTEWSAAWSMDRRSFLGAVAAAGAGGLALAACARAETAAPGVPLDRIGVQLYTLRTLMQQGVPETLQAVAEIGYREIEPHSFFGLSAQQFRAEMDRHGLSSPAGHYSIVETRRDLAATLANAQTLGQRWIVIPWLEESERTLAGYRRVAADLNRFGAAAREREMRVGYHNHEWEFAALEGGRSGFDILLEETDPALVDFELDLFWTTHAGRDPVAIFARQPGRFPLWHVKDMADVGGTRRMVDVGQGQIDFARIFANAQQAGLRHFFVEHDNPEDPMRTIRNSYQHLRQLRV
jgi:sugar phosphate isomerase/epimerase